MGMICRMLVLVLQSVYNWFHSAFDVAGVSSATPQSYADPDCVQSISGSNLAPSTMLAFAKTRKLSIERSDPRKYVFQSSLSSMLSIFSKGLEFPMDVVGSFR